MDTPSSIIPNENPLWVWKNILIGWVISPTFFPVLTGWCNMSVWGTKHRLQVTKPILFSTAHEGLQNCMLCWS